MGEQGNDIIANSLNNIGLVYNAKGNYDKALEYYHKALKIDYHVFDVDENHVEEQGNDDIAQSLNNIGLVYVEKMNIMLQTLNQKVKGNPTCPFCTSQNKYKKCCTQGKRSNAAKQYKEQALKYLGQSRGICYRIGLVH